MNWPAFGLATLLGPPHFRRSRTVLADGTWWKYTYDSRGQVTSAERRRKVGTDPADTDPVLPGQTFTYAYDGLGNRTIATQGAGGVTDDAETTYTPTTANQYSSIANNRTAIATGSANSSAIVNVNGSTAPRQGPWWGQSATAPGGDPAWLDFSVDATLGGTTNEADSSILIPPSTAAQVYDLDGNLTDDGLRTFTWDADNRLTSVTTKDTILPAGAPMYRVTYQYDDAGRRIAQTVEARTVPGGVYAIVSRRCILFDGWQCIAEYDFAYPASGVTRTLYRSQVWGADKGGGGAGGLLIIRHHTGPQTGTHFATRDGNCNVTALVDANTGSESASYSYDPYGNLLGATGPFAAENPYRFSTQYTDSVTSLIYYGFRNYNPVHGRWLSRDPIGEAGGLNLYGFIGNDGVNSIDLLGLDNAKIYPNGSASTQLNDGFHFFDPGLGMWTGPYKSEADFAPFTQPIRGPRSPRETYVDRMSAQGTGSVERFFLALNWGLFDGFSFGCAGKNSTLVEQARDGTLTERQFHQGLVNNGIQASTQVMILAMTGGSSSITFVGSSGLRGMALGGAAAYNSSMTEVLGNRNQAAVTGQPYAGNAASDAKFILINTAFGTFLGRLSGSSSVTITGKVCCKSSGGSTIVPVTADEIRTASQEAGQILAKAEATFAHNAHEVVTLWKGAGRRVGDSWGGTGKLRPREPAAEVLRGFEPADYPGKGPFFGVGDKGREGAVTWAEYWKNGLQEFPVLKSEYEDLLRRGIIQIDDMELFPAIHVSPEALPEFNRMLLNGPPNTYHPPGAQ